MSEGFAHHPALCRRLRSRSGEDSCWYALGMGTDPPLHLPMVDEWTIQASAWTTTPRKKRHIYIHVRIAKQRDQNTHLPLHRRIHLNSASRFLTSFISLCLISYGYNEPSGYSCMSRSDHLTVTYFRSAQPPNISTKSGAP